MMEFPAESVWLTLTALVFGLVIGSFLNVVIGRFPLMLQRQWRQECAALQASSAEAAATPTEAEPFNLAYPPSRCPKCNHKIAWYDNIPVVSWLLLKAKCRNCRTGISARYPLIELLTGVVFALLAWYGGITIPSLVYMGLACLLICLFFIDADEMILPDQMTYLMLWSGLLFTLYHGHIPLADAVIGAAAGYLSLWSVYWAFKLLTGKEGMGYGDFKLLAAFGAWAGYQMLPVIVIAAAASGAVLGIIYQQINKQRQGQPIPFGPFLICGGVIAMLWGEQILHGYWQWLMGGGY